MCGICGWQLIPGQNRNQDELLKMMNAIAHRGPDDRGSFVNQNAGLAFGHTRLSIIDLSHAGHQPMFSDDGNTAIIYNGELYNFIELRKELEELGHRFKSRSDTEVVLRSFLQWGISCIKRFNGMFAFAIWNAADNTIWLARDPLGMKPLYYTSLNGTGVAFASEIKAFLALSGFRIRVNQSALGQFLEFGYTFDQNLTSLQGVFKLPPGHLMQITNGVVKHPEPFYVAPSPQQQGNLNLPELQEKLFETLSEVVKQHLIADVPVGLLLSGGLDSSVVAALAAKYTELTTISMAFAGSEIDERSYARTVSRSIGSDHHEIVIHPEEISDSIEETAWYFDDLFSDWGTLSTRILYKRCREQGIKAVLVGEGSDELFGGYDVFQKVLHQRGPTAWRLFQLYRRYCGRRYGKYFRQFARIMRGYLKQCGGDMFHAVRLFESQNQLPNNYVMKVDKASMSVGVEARTPYLDRRVAELACRTPAKYLSSNGTNKFLLRSMAERYKLLPAEIYDRPKFGASMAMSWIDESHQLRSFARSVILDRNGWVDELGLRGAMTDYFDHQRKGYRFPRSISIFSNLAWRLLLLNIWSKRYVGA